MKKISKLTILLGMVISTMVAHASNQFNNNFLEGTWNSTYVQAPTISTTTRHVFFSNGTFEEAFVSGTELMPITKGTWYVDNDDHLVQTITWGAGPDQNGGYPFYDQEVGKTFTYQLQWINDKSVLVTGLNDDGTLDTSYEASDTFNKI